MARAVGSKPGLRALLTRFVISRRPLQTLAYEELRPFADPQPYRTTAFVLHGLLGSARTWRSFSRTLLSNLPDPSGWRMVLVDLRNHGRSAELEGLNPPHDLVNSAQDLANLIRTQGWGWPDVVLGHSFGGKVALQFAQSCARGDYGDSAKLPKQVNYVLNTLFSLHMVVAFLVAVILDNTVPGSRQERGVYVWSESEVAKREPAVAKDYQLPFRISRVFRWVKWVGI